MNINQKTVDKHRETRENIYRRTILIDILSENDKNTTQKIIQENIEEVKKAKDVMENIERWEWQNPVLMNNDGIPN
jgi:ubiquinone biosynthesis protein COQ9